MLAIVAATFLCYVGLIALGDPFSTQGEKVVPPEVQESLRAKFGLDEPFYLQYLIYLKNVFTGDLGIDFDQRRPVLELMANAAPTTVRLALLAIAIQFVLGIFAGVVAAVWQRSFVDVLVTTSVMVLLALPTVVIAIALRSSLSGLTVLGVEIFPSLPRPYGEEVPWFTEILLPAVALAGSGVAFTARIARTSMVEALQADYLRTARSKGLTERRVIFRHGLRNALIPVVNITGIDLGVLLGGALITESIFQLNGLGYLFIDALRSSNRPVMLGIVVYSIITFILLSAVVDMLCAYLDPRIRLD